jgi:hypothetical protein
VPGRWVRGRERASGARRSSSHGGDARGRHRHSATNRPCATLLLLLLWDGLLLLLLQLLLLHVHLLLLLS